MASLPSAERSTPRRRPELDGRPPAPKTRREERRARRIADREADRERVRRKAARPAWQDPTALITVAALAVGLLLFVFVVVRPFSGPAASASAPATSGNPYGLVKPSLTAPAALVDGRTLGKVDAPVTMDVWADFQCPYCGEFARTVEPQIVTNFVSQGVVKLVAHDFTFLGTGHDPDESVDAAVAARCADRQGRFWDYYMTLFWNQGAENSGAFVRPRLLAMADLLGLDHTAFQACLDDQSVRAAVISEKAQGVAAGVSGTPTSFINGTPVQGFKDYPTIAASIQAAVSSASPARSGAAGSLSASPSPSARPSTSP